MTVNGGSERGLWLDDAAQRADLATFVDRARRLDEAAVVRLRMRGDGVLVAWVATGFDVLACRVVSGTVRPADVTAGSDELAAGLSAMDPSTGRVDLGFPMDSAWRGALPPQSGFVHLDDVPARATLDLFSRGVELSKEHGSVGPPVSLLDQEVLRVSRGGESVGVPMRCVFALTAMGFVDAETAGPDEIVRIRVMSTWLRVDSRFGSVYRRRGDPLLLT